MWRKDTCCLQIGSLPRGLNISLLSPPFIQTPLKAGVTSLAVCFLGPTCWHKHRPNAHLHSSHHLLPSPERWTGCQYCRLIHKECGKISKKHSKCALLATTLQHSDSELGKGTTCVAPTLSSHLPDITVQTLWMTSWRKRRSSHIQPEVTAKRSEKCALKIWELALDTSFVNRRWTKNSHTKGL